VDLEEVLVALEEVVEVEDAVAAVVVVDVVEEARKIPRNGFQ
jgi:hypothetical protein